MQVKKEDTSRRTWELLRYSKAYEEELQIVKLKKRNNRFNMFSKTYINSIDSKNNIYFPPSDDEYLVTKYDVDGMPLLAFSRNYKREPYSQK